MLKEDRTTVEEFPSFVRRVEPRIRQALTAALGSDAGSEATADAMAYAWEHWDRVSQMDNPGGYLFVLGRNRGRRAMRTRPIFHEPPRAALPMVEPKLVDALRSLPERQRVSVMLVHCFEWTFSEVAALVGVRKTTVQNHVERGMARLRRALGVPK